MTIKTPARAALAAALAAFAVWGVAVSSGASMHHHHGPATRGKYALARQLAKMPRRDGAATSTTSPGEGRRLQADHADDAQHGVPLPEPRHHEFDSAKPPILVYTRRDGKYQLGALEWVFPKKPKKAPLKGAKYGSFPAACHYDDGTFSLRPRRMTARRPADAGSPFFFWHPDLVTLHVWLWYSNPDGLYASMNPFVSPFNKG